jgi:hypothetical protein
MKQQIIWMYDVRYENSNDGLKNWRNEVVEYWSLHIADFRMRSWRFFTG